MSMLVETLGVLAHRGGMIARHPQLTVGVVGAFARPTGLELDLLARRPPDPGWAERRLADLRARRSGPAPRRLLPAFDEGLDLRVGWLDETGRAHWEFGSWESSSDYDGFSLRTRLQFPPRYSSVPVALAWPEIGFPETVVDLPLPDRETVERGTVSIWDAPVHTEKPPPGLRRGEALELLDEPPVETGRIVAPPRVLHRSRDAAVVLTRVTAVGALLSMEIVTVAHGEPATAATAEAFPPRTPDGGPGVSIALLDGVQAAAVSPSGATSAGGPETFQSRVEYTVRRPGDDALHLLVAWPVAGLREVHATVMLLA